MAYSNRTNDGNMDPPIPRLQPQRRDSSFFGNLEKLAVETTAKWLITGDFYGIHWIVITGWWYTYPSEQMMEFVSWDHIIPNWMNSHIKFHGSKPPISIHQCPLPTFGWFLGQMLVNIPAPWSIWVVGFFQYLELLYLGPVLWIQFHVKKYTNHKTSRVVDEHNSKKSPIT